MYNENTKIQEIENQLVKLRTDLENLSQQFFKNNFTTSQTFTKDIICTTRLKVPHYTSAPSVGEVGDVIEVGGTLFICTTAGNVASPAVFTVCGTQT